VRELGPNDGLDGLPLVSLDGARVGALERWETLAQLCKDKPESFGSRFGTAQTGRTSRGIRQGKLVQRLLNEVRRSAWALNVAKAELINTKKCGLRQACLIYTSFQGAQEFT
jgi:hypothetical protein